MAAPTRTELESWKRPALQQKCKELGIKANSKSEVLIDLILVHYQAEDSQQPGPSKPSTSTKRKAAPVTEVDQDPSNNSDGDEEVPSDDNHVSAPQRQVSTRRRGAQPSTAPPAKLRRVGTKTRLKKEPSDAPALATPRHGTIMEVVIDSPRRSTKGKAKEVVGRDKDASTETTQSQEGSQGVSGLTEAAKRAMPGAKPLEPLKTTTTDIEIESALAPSIPPEASINETRISDLELQLRNVRKSNDEAARDIRILYAFQETIEQAFGDTPNLSDSMVFLAKLRDITPKLVAFSSFDIDGLVSRLEAAEQKVAALEVQAKQDQSTIAELKERVRELEEGKSAVGDLEATVRQIQSQLNALPAALTQNNVAIEDSGTERIYTIIRGPSLTSSSSAPQRPSSRLSVPPEENVRPLNQDQNQNQGRASSISRGRSTRPPLAEKEGVKVGQPDVEVETSDPRRSIRRLAESSLSSTGNSAPPSSGRSTTPAQREPPSGNATPSQGKGKARLGKSTTTRLDTVEEHGDTSIHEPAPSAPSTDASSASAHLVSPDKGSPAATSTTSTSAAAEMDGPERLPSPPPAPNPFSPDVQAPRSPARFFEVGQDDPSGSPPSSASKSSSRAATNRGSSPIRGLAPQILEPQGTSKNGPITQLPFKLIASPAKPQATAGPSTSRPAAPSGRVAKAPRSGQQPYGRRAGSSRKNAESTGEAPKEAASVFGFALPGAPSTSAGGGSTSATAPGQLDNPAGFITPERLGNNFNLFPSRFDLGQTPGGLAFKATGRPPPGTPAATTTLFGTEVARDTRFADLPYDPDTSREGLSWEEPAGLSLWPGAAPRNTNSNE